MNERAEPAEESNLFLVSRNSGLFTAPLRLRIGELSVGRKETADILLQNRTVSREHARLFVTADRVEVQDLGSHNGTFINEHRVERSELQVGQRVRFGSVTFNLSCDTTKSSDNPKKPSDDSTHTIHRFKFTDAQQRVVQLLIKGMPEKKVAALLELSPHTVHNHVRDIYRICGVHSRAALFRKLFPPDTDEL